MGHKWPKEVQALQELRNRSGASSQAYNEGLRRLKQSVFRELCEKQYLTECDASYCTMRYTGTCEYLRVWGEIEKQLGS